MHAYDDDMTLFSDEGEYICPVCTIFGLDKEEVQTLIASGLKMTDHNKEAEGYEVKNSAFKVNKSFYCILCTML